MSRSRRKRGPLNGGPPEGEPWVWITAEMLGAPTYGALSVHSRRILDALLVEHASHAGRENGRLAATYRQLEQFGVTKADIRKGFSELELFGFVRLTKQGLRQAGGGEPSRYALTWLPTLAGSSEATEATQDWRRILSKLRGQGITTVRQFRAWARAELKAASGTRGRGGSQEWRGSPAAA